MSRTYAALTGTATENHQKQTASLGSCTPTMIELRIELRIQNLYSKYNQKMILFLINFHDDIACTNKYLAFLIF